MGDKKAYLMQYRINEREIVRLQEECAMWRSRAEKVTATWHAAPGRGGASGVGFSACVEKMEELERELCAALEYSVNLRNTILCAIASIPDARARLLLDLHYIDGLTWEQVAEKIECEERSARRIHEKAMTMINVLECPGQSTVLLS